MCGYPPFSGDDRELFRDIALARYEFDKDDWSFVSSSAMDFIMCILSVDPIKRPTAAQLLDHDWLSKTKENDRKAEKFSQLQKAQTQIQKLVGLNTIKENEMSAFGTL